MSARLIYLSAVCLATLVDCGALAQETPPRDEHKRTALLQAKPLTADPKDDELRKLLKERYNAAVEETQARMVMYEVGRATLEEAAQAALRIVDAGLALHTAAPERIALLEGYVELAQDLERSALARHAAAVGMIAEVHRARYERAHAQILLLKEKQAAAASRVQK